MPNRPRPPSRNSIDGVKKVSIVMDGMVSSLVGASVELAVNQEKSLLSRFLLWTSKSDTHGIAAHRTIAIALIRSSCNTTDMVLRHQRCGNDSQHFGFVEKRSVAENANAASASPISGMECLFE